MHSRDIALVLYLRIHNVINECARVLLAVCAATTLEVARINRHIEEQDEEQDGELPVSLSTEVSQVRLEYE